MFNKTSKDWLENIKPVSDIGRSMEHVFNSIRNMNQEEVVKPVERQTKANEKWIVTLHMPIDGYDDYDEQKHVVNTEDLEYWMAKGNVIDAEVLNGDIHPAMCVCGGCSNGSDERREYVNQEVKSLNNSYGNN
jgi:hypothetical protein